MHLDLTYRRRSAWGFLLIGPLWVPPCFADDAGEWYARLGGLEAVYHSSARIATSTGTIPGASATVSNNTTAIVDVGYDITPDVYAMLMVGLPPRPRISGEGMVALLGELGSVTYGPAVLTAGYRIPLSGRFQPYIGAGPAYAIILSNHDGAISHLDVHNNFGFAVQAGAEYALNTRWKLFVDVKELWLSVNANGLVGGVEPVAAKVKLDPTLVSFGVKIKLN